MITELQIPEFDLITFFRKCSTKYQDISFLFTGRENEEHEWSILAFNSRLQDYKIITALRDPATLKKKYRSGTRLQNLVKLENLGERDGADLPFTGGWIGYLSYDQKACFRRYDSALLYNHKSSSIVLVSDDDDFEQEVKKIWELENPEISDISLQFKPISNRKWYDEAFQKVKSHILEGDVYQLNLTHQLESNFSGSSIDLFTRLANKNPAPMSAYLSGDNQEIISCSPERFLRLEGNKLETFPIKGTITRGKNNKEDRIKVEELLASEKEKAELNMITDLLRNDMGMVSKVGTVKVEKHREIMKLPNIIHTYSHISGELKEDFQPFEAFLKMFPGGSITGCPKKRAMEIIDEIEPMPRGVYTGCVGYLSDNGNMDFNIAIRTIIRKDDKLYLGVGGGIVADSVNESEYQETMQKAKAFMS